MQRSQSQKRSVPKNSASPAALPVAQDSPSASPLFGGVGPNDVPKRGGAFSKERLLCWGAFARTILRGGDVCLVEGGPWWGRKDLRCFGNTLQNSLWSR